MLCLCSVPLNTALEVLAITTRQDKPTQDKTVERRGNNIPIFRYDCLPKSQRNNNINKHKYQYKQQNNLANKQNVN